MATVTWAHFAIIANNRREAILALCLTILFAIVFTALQGYEYYEAAFTIADGVYGSTFFMATGFHGLTRKDHRKNIRKYNTLNKKIKEPYWVTGFADAESYFSIRFVALKDKKLSWAVNPVFGIELHEKDFFLLKQIQTFFGVGTIIHRVRNGNPSSIYSVQSITDLQNIIMPHFKNYPMLTQKQADFELFCQIIELMENKEHFNLNGLSKIISIRAAMNKGLSDKLKIAFPNIIPISRPLIKDQVIKNPYWLVGFVDGEGCFYIRITKTTLNSQMYLKFIISQHTRDNGLLHIIKNYLDCGLIETISTNPNQSIFKLSKQKDIFEKLIPFFNKYSLLGIKLLNFQDFCEVAQLMKDKEHLTDIGIEKIKFLKSGMNTGRK